MKSTYAIAKKYSDVSSIHGITYLFKDETKVCEKILWLAIVTAGFSNSNQALWFNTKLFYILGLICCFLLSNTGYIDWSEKRSMTTLDTTGYPIEEVEFPAISICSQAMKI